LGTARAAARAAALIVCYSALAGAADPKAGEQKAQVCFACHGPAGNSTDPVKPSLAQQPAQAIATQLYMFREGNRANQEMSPMAKNLSNGDMNDLAAYFSSQKAAPPKHTASPEHQKTGPELTNKFHCTQCHGPKLMGQQQMPRIAGQQFEYVRTQLRLFKAGKRADMDGNMTGAAEVLSDADVEALADYIAGLTPR
jgi:cytochrome c553